MNQLDSLVVRRNNLNSCKNKIISGDYLTIQHMILVFDAYLSSGVELEG